MAGKGYHNDQFFNLKGEGGTRVGPAWLPLGNDNPNFSYPDNTIRYGDGTTQQLKRGYIRTLETSKGASLSGIRKCQFQFNPTTLQQSVSMASGLLNMMQQDPAQWAQPVAASQNFSFTLFFDRSMELNNDTGKFTIGEGVDIWRQNSPGQVGVLRDLAALFSTIGQGFGAGQRAYIEKLLKDTIKAEAAASADTDSATKLADANQKLSSTGGFLDINMGNAAFLLPVPVRIVFSSLYVVEGLVQNTSVLFTKFSSSMVPMQCSVTITLEAKYIGFSKQRTFLTDVLEQRDKLEAEQVASDAAAKSTLINTLAAGLPKMKLQVGTSNGQSILAGTLFADRNTKYGLGCAFPGSLASLSATSALSPKAKAVSDLFVNGGLTLEASGSVTIYGPWSTKPVFGPLPSAAAAYVKKSGRKVLYSGTLAGSNASGVYATGNDAGVASDASTFHVFLQGANGLDKFAPLVDGTSTPTNINTASSYIVVQYVAKINASSSAASVTGSGEVWVVLGPNLTAVDLSKTLSLTWPGATNSNAATKPNAAGTTGNGKVTGNV